MDMNAINDKECMSMVHDIIKEEAKKANNPYFDMLIGKI